MPNRILKEGICRSDSIDSLSWFEEVLFYRLIVNCDDYGRYDGRSSIIKGSCFPLKNVTNKQIEDALNKLSTAGMVYQYIVDGKPFLQLATWENHQTIRAKKSKYPAFDATCNQMISSESNSLRNPIQSNSKSEYGNQNPNICSELEAPEQHVPDEPEPQEPAVLIIPLRGDDEFPVTEEYYRFLCESFPAVDIMQELRKMIAWCDSNPAKRKTPNGAKRFITSWLGKVQDKGGTPGYVRQSGGSRVEQFAQEARDWANNE